MELFNYKARVADPRPSSEVGSLDYEILIKCVFRCKRGEHGADASIFRVMGDFYKTEKRYRAEGKVYVYLNNALDTLYSTFPEFDIKEEVDKCKEYLSDLCKENIYACMDLMFKALGKIYPNIIYRMVLDERYDEANF